MMQATTTHTNTARRTHPAAVCAALRSPALNETYAYDDQNRRIKKSVGSATTNYLYNGADIHGEYTSWSNANAIYTHGPNTDEPLIRIAANDTRYYHQDGIGSVVATTDASGYLNAAQLYDAWGNPYQTAQLNSIAQYGYTGREPDGTGLVYYRARYYDPAVGRFAQRDPIGLQGGINRYAYVDNNPINATDPTGFVAKFISSQSTAAVTYYDASGQEVTITPGSQSLSATYSSASNDLSISADGLQSIAQLEAFSATTYLDQAGYPTIGYGHKLRSGELQTYQQGVTEPQALTLLQQDVSVAEQSVNNLVTIPLQQNQFDSLVSFTYNVGSGNFSNSTLLKKLNEGDVTGAADQFNRWNKVTVNGEHVISPGLSSRRNTERCMFIGGC
ncbi:MAG: glycoside hydrolase family protein [Nitrosomonadales bacterium]|nr:glycoside hydrolase family protein [Nitrosomonadales bacterium]